MHRRLKYFLTQIENEYGDVEKSYGQKGKDYVKWAASMALGLGAGVPWVMCKQTDAPENIIDACNGYYCDGFKPNSRTKPVLWTEDWDGWYVFVMQSSDKALLLSNKCFGEVFISRPMYQLALTVMLIGIWIK
jgi:hypothetical protein